MPVPETRIIGLGNPLMGDDGIGSAAIKLLEKENLPADIELIDGGCAGVTLMHLLNDCHQAIIIDAADFSAQPGTIRILHNPDLEQLPARPQIQLSHQPELREIFLLASSFGRLPNISLILMQVASCQPQLQLSREVHAALPELIRAVIGELSLGQHRQQPS